MSGRSEDGVETASPFVSLDYARNFAVGQMLRLGLDITDDLVVEPSNEAA